MLKYVIALVAALLLNATANLLLRVGMRGVDLDLDGAGFLDAGLANAVRLLLRHWTVPLGLGCFAANVVFYMYALQKLPISVAYPIMVACGFAIIVVVAGAMLKERLSVLQWVGVSAILVGVTIVAKDAGRQMGGTGSMAAEPKATSP